MSNELAEFRAMHREWAAGLLGFVVVFGAAAAGVVYLLVVYGIPERGWIGAILDGLRMMFFAFLAGAGGAWAAMAMVQRWHYAHGVYRCWQCNRPLRGTGMRCVCWPKEDRLPSQPRQRTPHLRRRVKPVLLTYAALLVPTAVLAYSSRRRHVSPADFAFAHVIVCLLTGTLIHLAESVLDVFGRGRRFRLRMAVFLPVFAVWPMFLGVVVFFLMLFGVEVFSRQ